jgi:protein-arginine kinase activator protein McsA
MPKLENYAIEELERTLEKLIDEEKYEEAAKVSRILDQKRNNKL